MSREQDDIKINYGEITLYYPFQFLHDFSFDDLYDKIKDNSMVLENFLKHIDAELEKTENFVIHKTTEILKNKYKINANQSDNTLEINDLPIEEIKTIIEETVNSISYDYKIPGNYELQLENLEGKIIFTIIDYCEIEAINFKQDFKAIEEIENKTYGNYYIENHKRYLLKPVKIFHNNDKVFWLRPELIMFTNGMCCFKVNFPIENTSTKYLKKNNLNSLFERIVVNNEMTFLDLEDYVTYLYDCFFKDKEAYFVNTIELMSLIDIDEVIDDVEEVSDSIIKESYLITNSPVPEFNRNNCIKRAREHFKSNSFSLSQVLYVVRSTGSCLLFPSNICLKYVENKAKERNIPNEEINHIIARDICGSTEFALIIILLEKMNGESTVYNLSLDSEQGKEAISRYLENKLFINNLQKVCFGSVTKQIENFRKMMYLYKNEQLINENIETRKYLITEKEIKEKEKTNILFTIVSIAFTFLFGLPTIHETLLIIKKCFNICDIVPYLSIEQISLFIWLLLIVTASKWLKNRMKK